MGQKHVAPPKDPQQLTASPGAPATLPAIGGLERRDVIHLTTKVRFNFFYARIVRRLKRFPVAFHQPEHQATQHPHPKQGRTIKERARSGQNAGKRDTPGLDRQGFLIERINQVSEMEVLRFQLLVSLRHDCPLFINASHRAI